MNDIQIFNNPQFGEIRVTISEDDKPMFCLADVCKALEISNVGNVKQRLSEKGIRNMDTLTAGGVQSMTYINEANLYKCIFQSRKAEAEKFQDWVFEEVLPSIRRTGAYISPNAAANAKLQDTEVKVYLIEAISRNLRLNDASRLGMYKSLADEHNLLIPSYVPSEGLMKSAKDLLKEMGSSLSAIKFNILLNLTDMFRR